MIEVDKVRNSKRTSLAIKEHANINKDVYIIMTI
jgi:hypothetical protein